MKKPLLPIILNLSDKLLKIIWKNGVKSENFKILAWIELEPFASLTHPT